MKKFLAIIISLVMAISLVACAGGAKSTTAVAPWDVKVLEENGEKVIRIGVFEPQTG